MLELLMARRTEVFMVFLRLILLKELNIVRMLEEQLIFIQDF